MAIRKKQTRLDQEESQVTLRELTAQEIAARLVQYERQYGMTSEAFYDLWKIGHGPDYGRFCSLGSPLPNLPAKRRSQHGVGSFGNANIVVSLPGHLRRHLIALAQRGLIVGTPVILHWEDRSLPKRNTGGFISIDPGIEFPDGARLKVHEKARIDGTTIIREVYSYSYVRPQGYFFRFDKEPSSDLLLEACMPSACDDKPASFSQPVTTQPDSENGLSSGRKPPPAPQSWGE